MSEFDYTGWELWKSYWRIGSDSGEEEDRKNDKEGDESVNRQARRNSGAESNKGAYEEICIEELDKSETEALWDGFEDLTTPYTYVDLEEQLQLQLNMNIDPALFTPTSSCPISPCTSSCTSSSSGDEEVNDEGEWEPSSFYLQRSASVSMLEAETHGLALAFKDEHIDPELKSATVYEVRNVYPSPEADGTHAAGEEGETMRDWIPPASSEQTGYKSVREARKALYPYSDGNYGTGEEGETMKDWPKVEYYSPNEVNSRVLRSVDPEKNTSADDSLNLSLVSAAELGSGFI